MPNQQLLAQEYENLKNYIGLISEHIIIMHFSLDKEITHVTDAYTKVFGAPVSDLVGEYIDETLYSPTHPDRPIWQILLEDGIFEGEMKLDGYDGQHYWLLTKIIRQLDRNAHHVGYIAISQDITATKLFEEQQQQFIAQSRHALMGEMISMIAHQWRQPLATMSAISANLTLDAKLGQLDPDKLPTELQKFEQIIAHLSQTIGDFNDFFKVDKVKQKSDIDKIIYKALELIEFRLQNINVITDLKRIDPLSLYRNELLQVLINIINNAIDAFEESKTKSPKITFTLEQDQHSIKLTIANNADPIPATVLPHIFEPYFSTKEKNGTGLGLYIVKTIVDKHLNGTIVADNLNEGCIFTITLRADDT